MKKVYITRPLMPIAKEILKQYFYLEENLEDKPVSYERLVQVVKSFHGLLATIPDRIDRHLLSEAHNLEVISTCAAGIDNIDMEAAREFEIEVLNVPDATTHSTADLTLAILLSLIRKVPEAQAYVREGLWKGWEPSLFLGEELQGKTWGILGYGKIGQAVAQRALGFGMKVIFYSRKTYLNHQQHIRQVGLDELYQTSDYLSIHVSLNPKTKGMVNRNAFKKMKKKPVIINMARGNVINTDDLTEALEKKWVRGAALDVTDPEPIHPQHPLCHRPDCLILPHIGSATVECRTEMARKAALNLVQYFYDE